MIILRLHSWLKQSGVAVGGGLIAIALTACSTSPRTQTPVTTLPPAPQNSAGRSEQAAVQVIRNYYSAIAHQDYPQAYSAWGHNGDDSQQSFEQFKQGFKNTASTRVEVGEPSSPSGAAGSIYIQVPVTVTATTLNGTKQQFRGTYVLKRINDVPGSTATQRQWHLYSADLTPVG